MLLMHGIGSFWQMWKPVLGALERGHDVIALDLPGFGASPPVGPGQDASPVGLADHVERFLDEQGWQRAHLVGNSLGGWIALELARRGRALNVCAISPAGWWDRAERVYVTQSLRATLAMGRAFVGSGSAEWVAASPLRRRAAFWQMTYRSDRMPASEAVAALHALAGSEGFLATAAAMDRSHFKGAADVPQETTTIAWGQHDRLLVRPQPDRARAAMPRARHIELAGCGHVPPWDDPRVVADAILSSV